MERPYFVMMYSQDGEKLMALMEDYPKFCICHSIYVASFRTREEARECAQKHPHAPYLGYKIFNMNE